MRNSSTLEEVQGILRRVIGNSGLTVTMFTTAPEVNGWDSLSHMHFIAETEDHFGVRFSFDEARSLKNIGDLVNLIDRKRTC